MWYSSKQFKVIYAAHRHVAYSLSLAPFWCLAVGILNHFRVEINVTSFITLYFFFIALWGIAQNLALAIHEGITYRPPSALMLILTCFESTSIRDSIINFLRPKASKNISVASSCFDHFRLLRRLWILFCCGARDWMLMPPDIDVALDERRQHELRALNGRSGLLSQPPSKKKRRFQWTLRAQNCELRFKASPKRVENDSIKFSFFSESNEPARKAKSAFRKATLHYAKQFWLKQQKKNVSQMAISQIKAGSSFALRNAKKSSDNVVQRHEMRARAQGPQCKTNPQW